MPKKLIILYKSIKEKPQNYPVKVRIEASTLCQLKCCSFQKDQEKWAIGKGYLKIKDFEKFILKHPYIREIELSNFGEIFLNPDLLHIIRCAYDNNIILTASNGVNFNTVSDEILEALVKYRFQAMTISIDGASQEVYSSYRINGNFDTVIENIKKLNFYKQKYDSEFPELVWQYILMEETEKRDDIIKAKMMAKELNMKIGFKLTWNSYKPNDVEMLREETGLKFLTRDELFKGEKRIYASVCYQLWYAPQINYDGKLLGCCSAVCDDFGVNVFKTGLSKALKSKNYVYAKKMLLGQADIPKRYKNIPCVNCSKFKKMYKNKIFLVE